MFVFEKELKVELSWGETLGRRGAWDESDQNIFKIKILNKSMCMKLRKVVAHI